MPEESVQC